MRLSAVLLVMSLAGLVGGAWLVGPWAVGVAVMADSLLVGGWALFRDDGRPEQPPAARGTTLADVLERARRAS